MKNAFTYLLESGYCDDVKYFSSLWQPNLYSIIKGTIEAGGAVLASYDDEISHCYFIDAKDGHYYCCINNVSGETITWEHVQTVKYRKHDQLIVLR